METDLNPESLCDDSGFKGKLGHDVRNDSWGHEKKGSRGEKKAGDRNHLSRKGTMKNGQLPTQLQRETTITATKD